MDEALPTAAALAIAGERVAGGVGTHELALPTPERVAIAVLEPSDRMAQFIEAHHVPPLAAA